MSEKRWLIRTRAKQILGPASLSKIVSLLEKNSLKDDDELTSGNGYWFWVKEKDLVQKYVYDGVEQDFNPMSEATTVLAKKDDVKVSDGPQEKIPDDTPTEQVIPSDEDLEFPNMLATEQDEGSHEEISKEEKTSTIVVEQAAPNLDQTTKVSLESLSKKAEVLEKAKSSDKKKSHGLVKDKSKSDNYLFILITFVILVLVCVFFYYKKILNKPIPLIGMNVYAQTTSLVKKKV